MAAIETIDLRTISEADARATAELICTIWPKPGRTVDSLAVDLATRWRDYHGDVRQYPRSFVVREDGNVIAHATAAPRTVSTADGQLTLLALSRVCTAPAARGRHLGEAMARAAFDLVDSGMFPFALFQTTDRVRSFYDRLGAVPVENRIVNSLAEDPTARAFWDPVVMRYPEKAGWPEGEIDLRGAGW